MRLVPLTNSKLCAIVDDADFDAIVQFEWRAQQAGLPGRFYATRTENGRTIWMHRVINQTPDTLMTDHADGNGLNNRRYNLRDATPLQNQMNKAPNRGGSSPLKGAWFDPSPRNKKQWRSAIRIDGKLKYLGRFETDKEAAEAYARAASEHFGDYHRTQYGDF
jgi:hypothetical protein